LSYFSLQFQREFTARSSKLKRDHSVENQEEEGKSFKVLNRFREEKKKENEEFTDSEPFKKEKKQLPVYFRISKRTNTKTESIQEFPKDQIKIPDKAR